MLQSSATTDSRPVLQAAGPLVICSAALGQECPAAHLHQRSWPMPELSFHFPLFLGAALLLPLPPTTFMMKSNGASKGCQGAKTCSWE